MSGVGQDEPLSAASGGGTPSDRELPLARRYWVRLSAAEMSHWPEYD